MRFIPALGFAVRRTELIALQKHPKKISSKDFINP